MTVNQLACAIYGGRQGNHTLGSQTMDSTKVSISGGVVTFDTSGSHRLIPTGPPSGASATPTPPGGYTKEAWVYGFNMARCSVAPAAAVQKCRSVLSADAFKLTESTGRIWTVRVCGVDTATYTPADSSRHHVLVYITKVASGVYSSATIAISDTLWVCVLVDKSVIYNDAITARAAGGAYNLQFGSSTSDANAPTWTLSDVYMGFSDRSNPIGKVTVAEWGLTAGVTPPTGNDQSTKSTGTDAAVLVDERPPAGSGTTDVDWYQLIDDGTHLSQMCALNDTVLSAGDALYAVKLMLWQRQNTSSKISGIAGQMHDGTTRRRNGGNGLATGPTSYAEQLSNGNDAGAAGGANSDIYNHAPDGNLWDGKANAYLDGCFAGAYMNGATANASIFVDALVVETAVVLSGDSISAIADPGVILTTQRRRGGVV